MPSASSSDAKGAADASSGEEMEFLLDVPSSGADGQIAQGSTAPTITLSDLKARIAEVTDKLNSGDGSEAFRQCVKNMYEIERETRFHRAQDGTDAFGRSPAEYELASGQAANSVLEVRYNDGVSQRQKGRTWLEGTDAGLFTILVGEETPFESGVKGFYFSETLASVRPLLAGEYSFDLKEVWSLYAPCDYAIGLGWTVTVTAPAGTVHEAFFDPVSLGTAVVADDYRGVLEPASYVADSAETTIRRMGWDASRAWVEFSSAPSLVGHHIDFIELDGSVGLRLDFDDAASVSTDDGGQALVWGACEQPWNSGDELMLRISESGEGLTGVTNDTTCDGSAVSLTVPLQTAVFSPSSDAAITPPLAPSGCGTAGLWDCLEEAESDGAASMITLFTSGALRVGFPGASVMGTVVDVRFEVAVRSNTGTLAADQYSFTVYSGSDALATLSGAVDLGSEWTEAVVSDASIASGLTSGLSTVAFQVSAPAGTSSGPRLNWSWIRMVVDYRPTAGSGS